MDEYTDNTPDLVEDINGYWGREGLLHIDDTPTAEQVRTSVPLDLLAVGETLHLGEN